ncbi:unnamed protein product [Acanthoscelides obtectus]|uniref:Uncharacterized protein n=1 Tax=Acanthoscelides obtectus TaxID=200917 RepID=A0A9P0KAI4_ACAOB|nr:unnamed protein product [Acanthoscelides obtectus]CAK1633511.1 hypothetical protein AOBTE_LOCUS8185 [Acanthoscelides obtectus]
MPLVLSNTFSKHTEQTTDNANLDERNELISIVIGASTSPTNFVNSVALDERKGIEEIYLLMQQHNKRFGTSNVTIQKCIQRLRNIKTRTSWESFLCTAGSSVPIRHRTKMNIKVQPTSISRRRVGIARGWKRLPIGRPPKEEGVPIKRKRNLTLDVK